MQIRPATLADIPSILQLERQSATAGHWTEEQYRQAFQRGGAARLVLVGAEDCRNFPGRLPHRSTCPPRMGAGKHRRSSHRPPKGPREAPSQRTANRRQKNKQHRRVSRSPRIQRPRPNSLRKNGFRAVRPPQVLLHKSLRRRHPLPPQPPLALFLTLRLHHFFGIEPGFALC